MDDEESVRSIGRLCCSEIGCTAVTASSAQEAIRLFTKGRMEGAPFDLLILDLTVNGGPGGLYVLKELLAVDPNIKAIVSSGYCDDPVMAEPEKFGFKGKLPKPYLTDELEAVITAAIRKK